MTSILRQEWNFTGYVVSDEGAIELIITDHKYILTPVDTVAACVNAGCNLELSANLPKPVYMFLCKILALKCTWFAESGFYEISAFLQCSYLFIYFFAVLVAYSREMTYGLTCSQDKNVPSSNENTISILFVVYSLLFAVDAIKQGKVAEATVRERVSPLFYTRMRLGEFDPPSMNPYSSLSNSDIETQEHEDLAVEAAVKSFVLLKNNGLLPLKPGTGTIGVSCTLQ
jgi:beta-glucosidase-like glycosyl hydrolase